MPPPLLVIDDDHDTRVLLRDLLERAGYVVHTAANGREALSMVRKLDPKPRLILLDLQMPVMDGWQFLGELRREAALAGIPVGVQSADHDRTLPEGVAFALGKPVDADALLALVRHHLGR